MAGVNWTNFTDLGELPKAVNDISGGSFWVGMLFMVWIILIMLTISFGFELALITSSFAGLIIGLLMVYSGLVAWPYVLVFVGVIVITFFYIIWSSSKVKA